MRWRWTLPCMLVAALAAADTKQERGSLIGIGQPGRSWLAEPDGTLASTDRMSIMTYSSWIAPASSVITAVQIGDLGAVNAITQARFGTLTIPFSSVQRDSVWVPGATAAPVYVYDYRRRRVNATGP